MSTYFLQDMIFLKWNFKLREAKRAFIATELMVERERGSKIANVQKIEEREKETE